MANKNQATKPFEVALEELEAVVEQLESGELSLEDSLAAFEKGVGLVKYCNQKLTEVEKKIEVLLKDKEGKLQLKALGLEASGERKEPDE
jgi:exodeoxyribonuclease VII small subunit